jgi:hypothetical protein
VLGRALPHIAELDSFERIDDLVPAIRPYIQHTIDLCVGQSRDYLIEGIEILPGDIADYEKRYGGVRACFLGNTTLRASELRSYRGENPWHASYDNGELERLTAAIRRWSAETAERCGMVGQPFIDIGTVGFDRGVTDASEALLEGHHDRG